MALDDWKLGVKKSLCSLGNLQYLFLEMNDWKLGVKKIFLLFGKSKNGMIFTNWYKNTFGTLEKKRNQYLNFFWKLVTEKSVSQNVKLGVVFGTFYCGIYVG